MGCNCHRDGANESHVGALKRICVRTCVCRYNHINIKSASHG